MKKTICELFAGVGGFRLGFEKIDAGWQTVWFSQWEPGKKSQWAHDCYVAHFGDLPDARGEWRTNDDICAIDKKYIPCHNLLVGGFPCQDYSVAHSLASAKGIEGKKGVLWWQIRDTLIAKQAPFCLFENVDRLLKSPAKQRGRDFGVMLACLAALGYSAEWRVVNAAIYGAAQRRRRVFIFAYKDDTRYGQCQARLAPSDIIGHFGLMAKAFPIEGMAAGQEAALPSDIAETSGKFAFDFRPAGLMTKNRIYTADIKEAAEPPTLLGEILEKDAGEQFYCNEDDLAKLKYLKSAKKISRTAANGHQYVFSEGGDGVSRRLGQSGADDAHKRDDIEPQHPRRRGSRDAETADIDPARSRTLARIRR